MQEENEKQSSKADQGQMRVPPNSVDSERTVLGAILRDNSLWPKIHDQVDVQDFYRPQHQRMFGTIVELINSNTPADVLTVHEALTKNNGSVLGEVEYLASLSNIIATNAEIVQHAKAVRDRRVLRDLIAAANQICDDAYSVQAGDASVLLQKAESQIFSIVNGQSRGIDSVVHLDDVLTSVIEDLDRRYSADEVTLTSGTPTGLDSLDLLTSGLHDGDLTIIAGRPAMGKTSLALGIGQHIATEVGEPVLVFTLESGAGKVARRILASTGQIDSHRIRNASILDEQWSQLTYAIGQLKGKPFYIDDTPGLSASEIRSKSRRFTRTHGKPALIIVDYLQLMTGDLRGKGGSETRAAELGGITRSLKNLAKELNCPVIVLSQLNRALEARPNKRPVLSDLRDSGSIEDDADVIIFVYQDEVYNPDSPDRGTAELIIAKQRNGPIGAVRVTWMGIWNKFGNYSYNLGVTPEPF